jgi:Protein of unknown function (DUF3602)
MPASNAKALRESPSMANTLAAYVIPPYLSMNPANKITKRGGAGNIVDSPKVRPTDGRRGSQDIIPEQNIVEGHENFHTGRTSNHTIALRESKTLTAM